MTVEPTEQETKYSTIIMSKSATVTVAFAVIAKLNTNLWLCRSYKAKWLALNRLD